MKIRIVQIPQKYEYSYAVEVWRWYFPFWVTLDSYLNKEQALRIAKIYANPEIVNIP